MNCDDWFHRSVKRQISRINCEFLVFSLKTHHHKQHRQIEILTKKSKKKPTTIRLSDSAVCVCVRSFRVLFRPWREFVICFRYMFVRACGRACSRCHSANYVCEPKATKNRYNWCVLLLIVCALLGQWYFRIRSSSALRNCFKWSGIIIIIIIFGLSCLPLFHESSLAVCSAWVCVFAALEYWLEKHTWECFDRWIVFSISRFGWVLAVGCSTVCHMIIGWLANFGMASYRFINKNRT